MLSLYNKSLATLSCTEANNHIASGPFNDVLVTPVAHPERVLRVLEQ